jgi:epoxyqueuosine reductase
VKPSESGLHVGKLEALLRDQGFHKVAWLSSVGLPQRLVQHPQIAALGEGTFLLAALSCYRREQDDASAPGDPHALIAPFARRNYYGEAVSRLKTVVRTLCRVHGLSKQRTRIFCNSRLPEKPLALLSGLGSFGKNSLILIPGLGSQFVIAGLFLPVAGITDSGGLSGNASLTGPGVRFDLCGSCRDCQEACPVGALPEAGRLDETRCLQALCTETVPFSEAFRRAWSFRFYGCQSCQEVCPHNRNLNLETETVLGELGPSVPLKDLLSLSVPVMKEYVRGTALARSWIPPRTLLRNALIAAGNRRDPALLQAVVSHSSSEDELVREVAAWAVQRISQASRLRSAEAAVRRCGAPLPLKRKIATSSSSRKSSKKNKNCGCHHKRARP